MDAAAELGRNSVSKHQIQPEYEDEQADAGRDCRTRLARPNSQHERGQGNTHFSCSANHVQDWQTYPVDPYSCYMCDHTYQHYLLSSVVLHIPRLLLSGLFEVNKPFYLYKDCVLSVLCCVFIPFIPDINFVGRTSRGHTTGGRSHI